MANKAAARKTRKQTHPWDHIRDLFVQGEDVKDADTGAVRRVWPTIGELAERFKARVDIVSREACKEGPDGQTWHAAKEVFRATWTKERDQKLAVELASQEVQFRATTMTGAIRGAQIVVAKLRGRVHSADELVKLTSALKKAQEIGLIAMDRPADGSQGNGQGLEDWTLIRKVRSGIPLEKV